MTTIHYDRPVKDLVSELSKTGHVTHKRYTKKSVTFHHNGAPHMSHEGVLATWRTREASAHFDSDDKGDLAQYVEEHEYAWAVGDTVGNEETISIEMANSSGAPHYEVADVTWESASRLAGWLFANVIHQKPSKNNVFYHHHWFATACPGPYMDKIYDKVLAAVQLSYEHFMKNKEQKVPQKKAPSKKTQPSGQAPRRIIENDKEKIEEIQWLMGLAQDGVWGPKTDEAVLTFRKKHLRR